MLLLLMVLLVLLVVVAGGAGGGGGGTDTGTEGGGTGALKGVCEVEEMGMATGSESLLTMLLALESEEVVHRQREHRERKSTEE